MAANNRKDISGKVFGMITVIEYSHTVGKKAYWKCVCSCGKSIAVHGSSLRSGNTKSCGHDRYKNAGKAASLVSAKHGLEGSPTYKSWKSMKERCLNKKHKSYIYYKNIEICKEWIISFESFLSDIGIRPEGTTLDRKDNAKGYCKENCRWATSKQQARNRSNNVFIENNGVLKTISEWAEITGIPRDTLALRIKSGWDNSTALTKPVKKQKNNRYGEPVRVAEWRKA